MNIAERIKDYYEHEDFIDNYAFYLLEDNSACIDRIKTELSKFFYFEDFTNKPILDSVVSDEDAERILEYLRDNYSEHIETFCNYYVGYYCIDSISFGEQCEQLTGLYNHKTGKDYTLQYLKKCFTDADFYVSGNYAYYDLSSEGVAIYLRPKELPFFNELVQKYTN